MSELLIILAKFLASSSLLMALYWVVLRNKASYRLSRLYILGVPFLSLLMSGLTFDVELPSFFVEETIEPIRETMVPILAVESPLQLPQADLKLQTAAASVPTVQPMTHTPQPVANTHHIDWMTLLFSALPIISLIMLLVALYYVGKLLVIKKRLHGTKTAEGYDLIRSSTVSTPFSFGRSIFLPDDLDGASEQLIINHEKAHIAHHHYLEVWLMELLTRLFWFNPIIWICRSELSNVHEFEADRDVLNSGANIHTYQTTLLEMVMSEACPVVNRFNQSFIRQRFIEMKKTSINTLGRFGKFTTAACIALLFCVFTFNACKTSPETHYNIPELADPQLFVIEGYVDENIADSCYNIYLADENFHIEGEVPDTCVQVTDKRFHYEIPLTKVTAGRVRCIFPGNELCSAWIDLFFVPGQTVELHVHNGNYHLTHIGQNAEYNYMTKIERAVNAVRNATGCKSPRAEQPTGKTSWEHFQPLKRSFNGRINKVVFADDATWVQIITDNFLHTVRMEKDIALWDTESHIYKLKESRGETGDDNWDAEARVFGVWYAFEPMPTDTKVFTLGRFIEGDYDLQYPLFPEVKEAPAPNQGEPNFSLTITASEGIGDCGYLVRFMDEDTYEQTQVADLALDENRSCTFTYHLDKQVLGETIATFPGGTICTHCERFPFIPGETAELRVYNGYYHLTGTGFYKDWANADEFCENANANRTSEESDKLKKQYLKEHGHLEGCLRYFQIELNTDLKDIYEVMSEEIRNSDYGRCVKEEMDREEQYQLLEARYANDPLPLAKVEMATYEGYAQLDDAYVEEAVQLGTLVLEKEYKGDDDTRPWASFERSKNGVKVYRFVNEH